jgi:pilus assembly protein CpaF
MVMMARQHIPDRVIRTMLTSAIHLVIHTARLTDGARRVTSISEVAGVEHDKVEMQDVFVFEREGISERGRVTGRFRATGVHPLCLDRLRGYGIRLSESIFREERALKA